MLSAHNLHKAYNEAGQTIEVLRALSADFNSGEATAIMGPSGCGKSTLVSILGGLLKPDEGEVFIQGVPIYRLEEDRSDPFRSRTVGFIFQQFHLIDHLTAFENARLPLDFSGELKKNPKLADQKVEAALAEVGLSDRGHHLPHQLSRGESQRVAVARVLVQSPSVILADEPTGSLDQKNGIEVIELLLKATKSRGAVLVVVTHDITMARLCDRIMRFQAGHLTRWENESDLAPNSP